MLPNVNFNPSFANLAALHGLGGGMPHPGGSVGPISRPIYSPVSNAPMPGPMPNGPMPGQMPGYPGMPMQPMMPGQMPQGNLSNLHVLMQLLGQQNV